MKRTLTHSMYTLMRALFFAGAVIISACAGRVGDSPTEINDDIPRFYEQAEAAELDSRKWLFVIGIEQYAATIEIDYSRRSAEWFARVAGKVLGVAPERQIVLLDEEATGTAIMHDLDRMLENVREGDHIYFYYSGHGIPVPAQDYSAYILPQDVDPFLVEHREEFRVENIYRKLMQSKVEKVIAFMDSCFTGMTDGKSVFRSRTAGVGLVPKKFVIPPGGKLAVLTAGTEKQYSGPYDEKGHRMFSYFVIRELLQGGHEYIGDLADEVSTAVTAKTMELGGGAYRQDPVLVGNRSLPL